VISIERDGIRPARISHQACSISRVRSEDSFCGGRCGGIHAPADVPIECETYHVEPVLSGNSSGPPLSPKRAAAWLGTARMPPPIGCVTLVTAGGDAKAHP